MSTNDGWGNLDFEKDKAFSIQPSICDEWNDLIHIRAEKLSETERIDLHKHLEDCQECRDEYEFTQKLFQAITSEVLFQDAHATEEKRRKLFAYYEDLYGHSPFFPFDPLSLAQTHHSKKRWNVGASWRSIGAYKHTHKTLLSKRLKVAILVFFILIMTLINPFSQPQGTSAYAMDFHPISIGAVSRNLPQSVNHSTGWVHTIAWSPVQQPIEGHILALAWSEHVIVVWSVEKEKELFRVATGGWGQGLAFSPDGKYLAIISTDDTTIQVLDVEKCIAQPGGCSQYTKAFLKGHSNWINALSWSPNGKYIASASADDTIRIWDASSAMLISKHQYLAVSHENVQAQYTSVDWSPDSTRIVTGDNLGTIQIWKALTDGDPQAVYYSPGGIDPITSVGWSPYTSRYIASAGYRGFAYVWDTETGKVAATLAQHGDPNAAVSTNSPIYSIAWSRSPNAPDVLALASNNVIQFYQENGTFITAYNLSQSTDSDLFTVAWSPDSLQLAVGGQKIVLNITLRKKN